MGCNCNNGCNGILATMQTGDTFTVQIVLRNGDSIAQITDGDIVVGFYDNKKNLLVSRSTADGGITYDNGVYTLTVSHDESLLMKKAVFMETSITSGSGELVYHGDKVIGIGFEARENNRMFGGEEPMPYPTPE